MIRNGYSLFFILLTLLVPAQEMLKPLSANINYLYKDLHPRQQKANANISTQRPPSSLQLPFIEDFSYAPTNNYPDQNKWEDSLVYVNTGMPIAPLSIGVATFDGLNEHGYPYNPTLVNMTASNPADMLTSKPINLYTSGSQTLDPSANVALSFYYQARGNGDVPELTDSLILDFYKPLAIGSDSINLGTWNMVWFSPGSTNSNINDTVFKRKFLPITDTAYFHDGFRFRFRNYASVVGDFDHWHLDYIFLNKNRGDSLADTVSNDLAFSGMPTPFLQNYSEMPVQQYLPNEMAKNIYNRIRNNSASPANMDYHYQIYDHNDIPIFLLHMGSPDNVNPFWKNHFSNPPVYGYDKVPAHAQPTVSETFTVVPPTGADFHIKHYILSGSGTNTLTDVIRENDTVMQFQRMRNFYAFDDGGAEAGYYINKPAAVLGVKIGVNTTDTLKGLQIYFDPVGNVSSISNTLTSIYNFSLCVWSANSSGVPGTLLLRDSTQFHPVYYDYGFKEVPQFNFKSPIVLTPGTYFVGVQQASSYITFGFDRNYDHHTSLYYNLTYSYAGGGAWIQSQQPGSIMIHPVFGTYIAPVGIKEIAADQKNFLVYPNPVSEQLTIVGASNVTASYQLFNSMGQLVKEEPGESSSHLVSTAELSPGMYILMLRSKGLTVQQQKIIVQH